MTSLYLYALLAARPRRGGGRGLGGQPLVFVSSGRLVVAAEPMAGAPPLAAAILRKHDAIIRRLARLVPALLPFRMGTLVADRSALAALLASRSSELIRALALVRGREQMTVRLYGQRHESETKQRRDRAHGPGTRYLSARRPPPVESIPGYTSWRSRLDTFVRAERVEGSLSPPLLASIYHLVERGQRPAYVRALRRASPLVPGVRIQLSGPWAPYAFVPESAG